MYTFFLLVSCVVLGYMAARELFECMLCIITSECIADGVQHAISLELLSERLVEGATVLDVGSGSGYLTACMSVMVSE